MRGMIGYDGVSPLKKGPIVVAILTILLLLGILLFLATKKTQAQEFPASAGLMNEGRPLPTYFWDYRTNLCFAYLTSRNYYGDVVSLATVPCTPEVRRVITQRPLR